MDSKKNRPLLLEWRNADSKGSNIIIIIIIMYKNRDSEFSWILSSKIWLSEYHDFDKIYNN